jgi:lipopolysaccharide biosynthesis glycosyltransferase
MSLAKRSSDSLRVIVLSMDVPDKNPNFLSFTPNQMNILNDMLKSYNPQSYAEQIDVTDLYRKTFLNSKNAKSGYTPYAFLRLFLDELQNIPDKLVYLDVDTMCTGDVAELYNIDISNYEYGATLDYLGSHWINRRYCNSGVLLLNIKKIRETGLFLKCRNMVNKRWMIMPDQSALNKHAVAKLIIHRKFNEQRQRTDETVVVHFCKGIKFLPFFHIYNIKQWDRENVRKKLKVDWLEEDYNDYDKLIAVCDVNA